MYIKPECMRYYYKDGQRFERNVNEVKGLAYISSGHMLPCCWCDMKGFRNEFEEMGFMQEELSLENNNSIEEILLSDEWSNWIDLVLYDPENAPDICKKKCGSHE